MKIELFFSIKKELASISTFDNKFEANSASLTYEYALMYL
jgi:hypothetical protein